MRTTIRLDDDIAAAVEGLRRERSMGVSEAVNSLARAGLLVKRDGPAFRQRTASLGLTLDVSNIGEALELLDDTSRR
jgi:hypothetical protein